MSPDPSCLESLRRHYVAGGTVAAVVDEVRRRIAAHADPALLIGPLAADLDLRAAELDDVRDRAALTLFGVPVVVKDNIDVAGMETTAGCAAFARRAETSADAVRRLVDAGAIVIGKTNLDQFATGLVGTRSPYGTPRNVLDPSLVPGGSSSGSAVAVAAGIVPIALGTDTAGSGRVPAAMNQIVGLKPTRGLISTVGVVPACASLDCVSIFASNVQDAWDVFAVLVDPGEDPWQRDDRPAHPLVHVDRLRIGVPAPAVLDDVAPAIRESFRHLVDAFEDGGATVVPIDLEPFLDAGRRLYGGPFVAERFASVGEFILAHPAAVVEPTRSIILGATEYSAAEYHEVQRTVRTLRRSTAPTWDAIDVLVVPSVPRAPTVEEVAAAPLEANAELGRFTTFANLLDLAALTIPDPRAPVAGTGATLYGPAGADAALAAVGAHLLDEPSTTPPTDCVDLVVVGAHLEGQPANVELTERGAAFVAATTTAAAYRLWALPDGRRPALERVGEGGCAIEVEVWSVPTSALGGFVAGIAPPLAIGHVELADGSWPLGFVCELGGLVGAVDITDHGGWRSYHS